MKNSIILTICILSTVLMAGSTTITLQDNGNGTCTLGYSGYSGDALSSISLRITSSASIAYTTGSTNSYFNFFPDYFYSNPSTYTLGSGNPIANPNSPGALTPTALTEFSISMSGFWTDTIAPNSQTILAVFSGADGTTVNVELDTERGGIYDIKGNKMEITLPAQCTITN